MCLDAALLNTALQRVVLNKGSTCFGLETRVACAHDNQSNAPSKAAKSLVTVAARAPFQGGEVTQAGWQGVGRGGETFTTFAARTHTDTNAHIHRPEGAGV